MSRLSYPLTPLTAEFTIAEDYGYTGIPTDLPLGFAARSRGPARLRRLSLSRSSAAVNGQFFSPASARLRFSFAGLDGNDSPLDDLFGNTDDEFDPLAGEDIDAGVDEIGANVDKASLVEEGDDEAPRPASFSPTAVGSGHGAAVAVGTAPSRPAASAAFSPVAVAPDSSSAGQKRRKKQTEKRDRSNGNPKGRPPGTKKKHPTKPQPAEPDNRTEAEVLQDLQATGFDFAVQGGRVWPQSPPRFEPQQPTQPALEPPFMPRPEGPYWPYKPHVQYQPPSGPKSTQPFRPLIGYDQFGNPVFGHSAQHFSWDDALNGGTGYGPRPGPGDGPRYNIPQHPAPRPSPVGPYHNSNQPGPRPPAQPPLPNIYQTPIGQLQPQFWTPPGAPQGYGGAASPADSSHQQHITGGADANGSPLPRPRPRPRSPDAVQSGRIEKGKKKASATESRDDIRGLQERLERQLAYLNNNYGQLPRPSPSPAGPSVGVSGTGFGGGSSGGGNGTGGRIVSSNNYSASGIRPGFGSGGSSGSDNNSSGSGFGNSNTNFNTRPPVTTLLQPTSSQPPAPPVISSAVNDWIGVFGGMPNGPFGSFSPSLEPSIAAPPVTNAGNFSPISGLGDPEVNMDDWTKPFTPPPSGEQAAVQAGPVITAPITYASTGGFSPTMVTAGPAFQDGMSRNGFDEEFDAGGAALDEYEEEEQGMEGGFDELIDWGRQSLG